MGIITDAGLDTLSFLIPYDYELKYIATGTSTTAEANTDTTLGSENTLYGSARKAATVDHSIDGSGTTSWDVLFSFTGPVTVREYGIFNQSSAGTMLYRRVLSANRTYTDGDSMQLYVTMTFARS